eukprot:scpid101929/ scgid10802/ 
MLSSYWILFSMAIAVPIQCQGQCPDKYQRLEMRIQEVEAQLTAHKEMNSITASRCTAGMVGIQYQSLHNQWTTERSGLIATIAFTKKHNTTLLKLTHSFNIAVYESSRYSRWYFQIDGKECVVPSQIDIVSYHTNTGIRYSPAVLTGIC